MGTGALGQLAMSAGVIGPLYPEMVQEERRRHREMADPQAAKASARANARQFGTSMENFMA